jgi:sigma-B regulation protein RsbU (phosphoserine phosphatase)
VFPLRLPPSGDGQPGFAQLEVAMWAGKADSALWPLRRNLIINCTAACALLFALITMRLRFRSYLRGRRLESELEIAREVQRALQPSGELAGSRVATASQCVPASGIAGDIHDVFESADGKVALVCGDVSGKGIPAALLMGVLHGAVRSLDWYDSASAHEDATRRLNRMLCDRASDARFATLFWGYYDARFARLHYINAGHCAPLLVRSRRDSSEIRTLNDGGPVLGLLRRARYEQSRVDICPGDLLVLYSDGIVEATNAVGEEFGEERLRDAVRTAAARTPEEIRTAVLQAVRNFAGTSEFADDLTLMAVRFCPEAVTADSDSVLVGREVLTA